MAKARDSENKVQRKSSAAVHGQRARAVAPRKPDAEAPLSTRALDYEGRIADLRAKIHELEESRSTLATLLRDLETKEGRIEHIHQSWVAVFDAIVDPIFMHDRQGRVMRANHAYAELAGMDVKDVIGRLYWRVFPRREGPLASCSLTLSEKQDTAEEDLALETGQIYRCRFFTLRDRAGGYLASLHIMQDITERKGMETALRQERDFISAVMHTLGALVVVLDREGRIIQFNHACETVTGFSFAEIEGRLLWDALLLPEELDSVRTVFNNLRHGMFPNEHENYWRTKDGSRRLIHWSNTVLTDESGAVQYLLATGIDITDRKTAEDALRGSEARFRALIENSSDITTLLDRDGIVRYTSPSIGRVLGYDDNELVGRNIFALIHPDDLPGVRQALANILENPGLAQHVEHRFKDKDGVWRYLESVGKYFRDDSPVSGIVVNSRDITARMQAENSLREAESLYRSLYKASPDGILLIDPETGRQLEFNEKAHEYLGYSREEFARMRISDYDAAEKPEEINARIEKILREGKDVFETKHRAKDGRIRDVFITVQTIERGERRLLYAVIRDITDIKQANDSLRKLNRALRTLSGCNESLVHAMDEQELLAAICEVIVRTGGYRFAWVGFAEHDDGKSVRPMAFAGEEAGFLDAFHFSWGDNESGHNPIGEAIRAGSPRGIGNIETSTGMLLPREEALRRGYISCIALPLRNGDTVMGVLAIYAAESDAFDDEEVKLLMELADDLVYGIGALRTRVERERAMEQNRLNTARMEKALLETIEAIGSALEKRDPYTAGHQRQVAKLAHAIAQEMKLPQAVAEGIYMGCLIHDIGKIYIPAEILSRPGTLTNAEFEIIKCHPQVGYDIIKGIEFPWPVAKMILEHHERMNGSGYPQGLKGGEISLEARILAVADVVEAMASHRPYRPAVGLDRALEEISQNREILYDPQAVDVCLRLFREKGFQFDG
jgi:PAS domain S-box-containing protein/putative nucleotidyltransferase with HDIG domain